MCGIAGWVGPGSESPDARDRIHRMLDSMRRRGPDAEGLERFPGAILGHRRLAIFDLTEAGRQPMTTADGSVSVVFNGAIYNFRDLRQSLRTAGETFRSDSDTEVLLAGYRQWGISGLVGRLRGMFAFALWDAKSRRLYLVRDRLGVKPLLYVEPAAGELAFASTAAALRAAGLTGDIDPYSLAHVIRMGYVPDERCIYENLKKLPPGHILEWSDGKISLRPYWAPAPSTERREISFGEAVERTEEKLLEAVRLRLAADVPVGCLLSGGVDSSLVAWAAARHQPGLRMFTVATPGDPADESGIATRTAQRLGLEHEVIPLEQQSLPPMEELVSAFGEPFPCSSAIGLLGVSKTVKPYATVLLTGDGGDEAFLGYPEYRTFEFAQRLSGVIPESIGRTMAPGVARLLATPPGPVRRPLRILDYSLRGIAAVRAAQAARWQPYWADLAGPRLSELAGQDAPEDERCSGRTLMDAYVRHQRETVFVGEYLPKVDGATMHHGLEARSPFLDHELWQWADSLPYRLRLHRGRTKAVLRALAANHIGDDLAYERKRGFTVPVERWLANRWSALLDELEQGSALVQAGWVSGEGVRELARRAKAEKHAPTLLWHLVVADAWLQKQGRATAPA